MSIVIFCSLFAIIITYLESKRKVCSGIMWDTDDYIMRFIMIICHTICIKI